MVKPLWALAGVALLGTAGVAGAVIVASSGGEEEVVEPIVATAPSTVAPSPAPDQPSPGPEPPVYYPISVPPLMPERTCPSAAPASGTKIWRWGDVAVLIREESGIHAGGMLGPHAQPVMAIFSKEDTSELVQIDAFTGEVVSAGPDDDFLFESQAEMSEVLETLSVCPFDASTAPWPYTGQEPTGPRQSLGKLTFLEPDPASGVQRSFSINDPGGTVLTVQTARSRVAVHTETGAVVQETARIHPSDEEAFERYIATIQKTESASN